MMQFKNFYLISSQRIWVFIKLMLKQHYRPFKVICYIFIFHNKVNDISVTKFSCDFLLFSFFVHPLFCDFKIFYCYREWHLNCSYKVMMTRKKLSRRTFAIGLLAAGVCEAATPIIDLNARKLPLINSGSNSNFFPNTAKKNFGDLDSLYFDPEPELSGATGKFLSYNENSFYRPQKRFSLNLRNANTSETYSYRIKSAFFDNELNYDVLDYFFRDWRENKTIQMDRGVIKNFLKICEALLGADRELAVDVTSGYRTQKTNEKLRQNSSRVAKNSMHLVGRAIDFKVKNRSIGNLEKVAKKLTPGGLGVYSGFIHIDTGPHRRWKT